ncbi:hypothetical protein ACC763_38360, partial [Rhizobium ruizarguesonis]
MTKKSMQRFSRCEEGCYCNSACRRCRHIRNDCAEAQLEDRYCRNGTGFLQPVTGPILPTAIFASFCVTILVFSRMQATHDEEY